MNSLIAFYQEEARLPKSKELYNGQPLGKWFANRLKSWRRGKNLTLLEKIKDNCPELHGLILERIKNKFLNVGLMVDLLLQFCQENGRLPNDMDKYQGYDLGRWVKNRLQKINSPKY